MVSKELIKRAIEGRRWINREKVEHSMAICLAQGSQCFSEYSPELLWMVSREGNRQALSALYQKTQGYWLKFLPYYDASRLHTSDDWKQIGAEEFSEKWNRFRPEEECKFSTFIVTVIRNRFRNELRYLGREIRQMNVLVDTKDLSEWEDLLPAMFTEYDDTEFFASFVDRFRVYISLEVDESVMTVLDLQLHFSDDDDKSVEALAGLLRRSTTWVRKSLRSIREHALDFAKIERLTRHGDAVYG